MSTNKSINNTYCLIFAISNPYGGLFFSETKQYIILTMLDQHSNLPTIYRVLNKSLTKIECDFCNESLVFKNYRRHVKKYHPEINFKEQVKFSPDKKLFNKYFLAAAISAALIVFPLPTTSRPFKLNLALNNLHSFSFGLTREIL